MAAWLCAGAVAVALTLGMGGCQGEPDFVITDAFAKDMPLSLANTLEGAMEAHAAAQSAVMEAMSLASAPVDPEQVGEHYEDVRVAATVAERRIRTADVRYQSAEGRMQALTRQWARETNALHDAAALRDSERRLDALRDAWDKIEDAEGKRADSRRAAMDLIHERVIVLRHSRSANQAAGSLAALPAPWPIQKAGPVREAVLRDGEEFVRACREMRLLLPTTAPMSAK